MLTAAHTFNLDTKPQRRTGHRSRVWGLRWLNKRVDPRGLPLTWVGFKALSWRDAGAHSLAVVCWEYP